MSSSRTQHNEACGDLSQDLLESDALACTTTPLRFLYTDSTIPLLPKSEASSFCISSVAAQAGLCRTLLKTLNTGFLMSLLILQLRTNNFSV